MRDPAMGEPRTRIYRMRYESGPMGFLSDQIQKEMQRAGYPVKEFNLYRSAESQQKMLARRASRAGPYQSAHQYFAATDLIHERWAWFAAPDAPDGEMFWQRLWDCVDVVAERHRVEFDPMLSWDKAHIELKGWENFRDQVGQARPSRNQLDHYFAQTLPKVWKQYQRRLNAA